MLKLPVIFLFVSCFAQGQIMRLHEGATTTNMTYLFPIVFYKAECRFALTVINQVGDYVDYSLEQPNCTNLNYTLVIDGYGYVLPSPFSLYYFNNAYSIFELIDFGICSRSGGGSITNNNNNTATLYNLSFDTVGVIEYKVSNSNPQFIFNSVDGDIVCSNGVLVGSGSDTLFVDGFEL